jgi:hypothetical protein
MVTDVDTVGFIQLAPAQLEGLADPALILIGLLTRLATVPMIVDMLGAGLPSTVFGLPVKRPGSVR